MNDAVSPTNNFEAAQHATVRGLVSVCPRKLTRILTNKNLNVTSLSLGADLSRGWLIKVKKGEPVLHSKLQELCEYLKISVESLLPDTPAQSAEIPFSYPAPSGWKIVQYLGPPRAAANRLAYRVVKLQHEFIPEKLARGKFYDLLHVSQSNRSAFVEHLTRHARVCARIGLHPNIAENLTVHPVLNQDGWWVIDKWIAGASLEELVNGGTLFTPSEVQGLGRGILSGLWAMHDKQVVFRELAPDKVHLIDENSQVLLTDFEMAKLADGSPSVSHRWEPSYFRAPELGEFEPSAKVDLYAFARVLLWVTSKGNTKVRQFEKSGALPSNVAKVLNACLEPLASKRPASVEAVEKIWSDWK